jgi:hypothetical protein
MLLGRVECATAVGNFYSNYFTGTVLYQVCTAVYTSTAVVHQYTIIGTLKEFLELLFFKIYYYYLIYFI